ncbi:MAG: polyprenyl synthetase family protein [Sulfobacillus sp.]
MTEEGLRAVFEAYLQTHLPVGGKVEEAMAYALGGGGKRLRPVLVLMAAEAAGGDAECCLPAALAVEAVHTYSLVHDDLPDMDDDDWRRGRPSCHRAFGPAVAILAGDGLLTWGLGLLADPNLRQSCSDAACLECLTVLTAAIGTAGMVGGQALDLGFGQASRDQIDQMKTAALFGAAAQIGAILAGRGDLAMALRAYGEDLGRAFQAIDDRLDLDRSDQVHLAELTEVAERHSQRALQHLAPLEERGGELTALVERLSHRQV